jgi:hypothetical protein
MHKWAMDARLPYTFPKWNRHRNACQCDLDDDPAVEAGTLKTPVWIAPTDIVSLYPHATYPSNFPYGAGQSVDHVKACLSRTKLSQLWNGQDAHGNVTGPTHCHQKEPFVVYTGWDGDIYCGCTQGMGELYRGHYLECCVFKGTCRNLNKGSYCRYDFQCNPYSGKLRECNLPTTTYNPIKGRCL